MVNIKTYIYFRIEDQIVVETFSLKIYIWDFFSLKISQNYEKKGKTILLNDEKILLSGKIKNISNDSEKYGF